MKSTQYDAYPAPDALWSTKLGQSPAGPLLVASDLLLVPTQEAGPPSHHATLHALGLADGSPRWRRSFEYALVTGLAAAQTSEVFEGLILVATISTDLMRGEGALVALTGTGEERWRWVPGVHSVSAPALVRSDDFSRLDRGATKVATTNSTRGLAGIVCVTADAQTLVTLDLVTGKERAKIELEASASLSAPALVGGVAYVPCRGPHLLAVVLSEGTPPSSGGLEEDPPPPRGGWGGSSPPLRGGRGGGWTRPPS